MKAISTKVLVSQSKGLRLKASDGDYNSITISSDPTLDPMENHRAAAVALARKMEWLGTLQGGYTSDGFVWVFIDKYLSVEV